MGTMTSSEHKGVRIRYTKAGIARYYAEVKVNAKNIHLGTYGTEAEAVQARSAAEIKYDRVKLPTMTIFELRAAADYEAFVYLWYDSNCRKYYLGSHAGSTEEQYAHSCKNMPQFNRNNIPNGWRRRILARGTEQAMRDLETLLLINRKLRCWTKYYNKSACSSAVNIDKQIDVSILYNLLAYDADTGMLTWKTRCIDPSKSENHQKRWNSRYVGKQAGWYNQQGYIIITLFNKLYRAHRLAWAMHYGVWPTQLIDHINGDPADNRIVNLRQTTQSENNKNRRKNTNNTSGYVGVHKVGAKWRARIAVNGKNISLGMYDTVEQAAQARKQAEINYGFHENHGRI
jgi:hypothetical protein